MNVQSRVGLGKGNEEVVAHRAHEVQYSQQDSQSRMFIDIVIQVLIGILSIRQIASPFFSPRIRPTAIPVVSSSGV